MTFGSALTSLQVDSILSYVIAIVIPALDAIFPVLPSETAVIALGVATAGSTDPRIALPVACAALGAFLGDNLCYLIGRKFGPRVERRFFSSARGARQRAWAEHSLDRYGTQLIVVCRFIPGGRTAVTLCCGLIGYPRRRYVPATAVAAALWATYSFFIGRLGGRAFEDNVWAGLLLSVGITLAISAVVEAFRRIGRHRKRQRQPEPAEPAESAEPAERTEPAEPAERAERAERAGAVEPDQSGPAGDRNRVATPGHSG